MACLEIFGGKSLYGELTVQGSKNAVLPILAACLLCGEKVVLKNCPKIYDVTCMESLLEKLGAGIFHKNHVSVIDCKEIFQWKVEEQLAQSMRASVLLAAPLLARCGQVRLPFPGGCVIGARPIDLHMKALEKMQVDFTPQGTFLHGTTKGLQGAHIKLPFPSVGTTEQIVLAAVLAKGDTIVENAAREPEVYALCDLLSQMGGKITGAGSSHIRIEGVKELKGLTYTVPSDRIVAATYIAAVGACTGELHLSLDCMGQMKTVVQYMKKMGITLESDNGNVWCRAKTSVRNIEGICTDVYPGFPTDMQSIFLALMATGDGVGSIKENIFESRFACVEELNKMGADISIDGRNATVTGRKKTRGARVVAKDLRGGAALMVAGLAAQGETVIQGMEYLERGYEELVPNLSRLGAKVRRIEKEE